MNEPFTEFRIPRSTGTHADVLAAVGLADLLASLPGTGIVRLVGGQADFTICPAAPISTADLNHIPQVPGYPFLKANDRVKVPSGIREFVDYGAEKAKAVRMRQLPKPRRGGGRTAVDPETQQLMQQEQLRDDWRLLQVLNTLQGDETANRIHEAIVKRDPTQFRQEISAAMTALSQGVRSQLDWKVTTVQIFTPIAAKGYSRLKPDSTDRNDKTKEQWADAFVEWLKYRGYFRVACPFFQGQRAEHVRLLVPIPQDISVQAVGSVTRELRKGGIFGGAPKIDSLAVLRLAQLLIRHSEEYHDPQAEVFLGLSLRGKVPSAVVSGVMVTHYQSLGSAKSVSSMSVLALPGWFQIHERQDADAWLAILDEHQRAVRGLLDDRSDEIGLLVAYRRFLESRGEGAVWALLAFMEQYGPFMLRAREQRRKVRSFRTDLVGRILMGLNPELREVLLDRGFQAVATAVRRATVNAQAQKALGVPDHRDIRYDLLHELRRKRSLPGVAPFVEAVSDFVSLYNAENARRREMRRLAPRNVTTEEFASFVQLVNEHGASLVGALLCAYGTCREPRDTEVLGLEGEETDEPAVAPEATA